jgi:predicted unusual protein kinase regulating ubiquinone biosynthesis (AarF/ABC1/UbiB family)
MSEEQSDLIQAQDGGGGVPKGGALTSIATGLRGRTWVTAKLTTMAGLQALTQAFTPGGNGRAKEAARSTEKSVASAEKILRQLDQLKGVLAKAGQMASYLDPSLPPEARQVLAKLQSQGRPMAEEVVEGVLVDELGAASGVLFEEFDSQPFAAASIGQVHQARLKGQKVAVKVQYPGIEEAIRHDLDVMGALARVGTIGMALDSKELFDELRDRLLEECDYRFEARWQERFRAILKVWPNASVPAVVPGRSAGRVLTSDFVDGLDFYEFCRTADQEAKDRAGQLIFEVSATTIHQHCLYNADPQPGNYLFSPDGRVTFLDFGCIRQFSTEMVTQWKTIAQAVLGGDQKTFREAVAATGMVVRPDRFDWDYHWKVLLFLYQPYMTPGFRYSHDFVRQSFDVLVKDNPNTRYMTFPREWVWVNRLQWGLNSVLAHLEARGPWDEIWRAAVEHSLD